ncbi:MAG: ACT domain-containing protein [Acidimicrobiales bacterium]|nr:ACT domain-containing protein [Acidimicrobiales bacterium]HRW39521.1 ACT domain-containing protein [Aquihabitans sp.]
METYVLRVWLPDRPGALGAVASRIGAVKGDVTGIEILETGAGQAVDELVVRLPDATLVDLLVSEVRQVDGVQVEEVRAVGPAGHDPRSATLETAAQLVGATSRAELLEVARDVAPVSLQASWVAVVDLETSDVLAAGERSPTASWIGAFVHGARSAEQLGSPEVRPDSAGSDVIWAKLPEVDLAVVAGRERIAWREREKRELDALAHIVAIRWSELPSDA